MTGRDYTCQHRGFRVSPTAPGGGDHLQYDATTKQWVPLSGIYIDSGGQVGINTLVPLNAALHVNGDIRTKDSGKVFFWSSHDQNYIMYNFYRANTSGAMKMQNVGSGSCELHGKTGYGIGLDQNNFCGIGAAGDAAYRLQVTNTSDGKCVRLIGDGSFGSGGILLFGDPTNVYLEEDSDDYLRIHAKSGIRLTVNTLSDYCGVGTGTTNYSTWEVQGSRGQSWVDITNSASPYSAGEEATIECDATAGNIVVNLPSFSSVPGRTYYVTKIDASANTVTVQDAGGGNINGAATYVMGTQYDRVQVQATTNDWRIID